MILKDIQNNDVFSELSYYKVAAVQKDLAGKVLSVDFKTEDGRKVRFEGQYVDQYLIAADQYESTEKVTKTRIREIFEAIGSEVFTVGYIKQDQKLSKTKVNKAKEQALDTFRTELSNARSRKRSMALVAEELFTELLDNPITDTMKGESRVLRGYKKPGFVSIDGKYKAIDMDIDKGNNERFVNINTIHTLVVNNVKYLVK